MKFSKLVKTLQKREKPLLAVLVDPDKFDPRLIALAKASCVSCFLVGGSRLEKGSIEGTIRAIKKISRIPVILFPGDENQLHPMADGLLLLSLLSGRDPEYLIEKHIRAAPLIKRYKLPFLSTAYMLINGARRSTTEKVTGTRPLDPANQEYIANTSLAAEQLGFGAIYLEAGSGAAKQVNASLIKRIKKTTSLPLIVGGGIDSAAKAKASVKAGADMIVVGNALEKNVYLLAEISKLFSKKG
jgi:phosphoglycerol geranylgeranyltransferase